MQALRSSGSSFCFYRHTCALKNLNRVCAANAARKVGKGFYKWRQARKHYRPVEDISYQGVGPHVKVKSLTDSLSARGFQRELQSYNPPENVLEKLHEICKAVFGSEMGNNWEDLKLSNSGLKYKLLTKCIRTFSHDIPSSYLCKLRSVKDVVNYFSTPVEGISPYEALVRDSDKLPPNLHVMPEPLVFNPDTDTFFDGKTAFPGRKRIIFTKRGEEFEKTIRWPHV